MYDEKTYLEPPKYSFGFPHAVFALLALFLGIFYGRSVWLTDALRTVIFTVIFIAAAFIYIKINKVQTNRDTYIFMALTLLFSCRSLFIQPNDEVGLLWFFVLHLSALISLVSVGKHYVSDNMPYGLLKAIFAPFRVFFTLPVALFKPLAKFKKTDTIENNIFFVIFGIFISVPLLLIVGSLLIKDAFFLIFSESFLNAVAEIFADFQISDYINPLTLFMAFYIFAAFYNTESEKDEDYYSVTGQIPSALSSTVIIVLLLCYAVFFIAQLDGILSLLGGTIPGNISIAEFACSGFFDLCMVAVINGVVLYLANAFFPEGENNKLTKILSVILIAATLLLIVTSFSKMLFYIISYGFTPKRFYTVWFMLLLFISFILSLIKVKKHNFPLSRLVTYITSIMLIILFFIDYSALSQTLNNLRI